ncbi:MAG: PHP domain-containing protein [SAR324 cluster bacterium]|nr:PHP domain-containing protein [SAR324 cluster bacterium]
MIFFNLKKQPPAKPPLNSWLDIRLDLHMHSSHSDGTMSVPEIINHASKRKIQLLSLTDHDTLAGIKNARKLAKENDICFIPGIEISAKFSEGACHVLGYFIDEENSDFLESIARLKSAREVRNEKMIAKLNELGLDISLAEILDLVDNKDVSIGRPHLASIMVKKNYVKNFHEAFQIFLGVNGKAYVDKELLSPQEAIEIINKASGMAFIAHPTSLKLNDEELVKFFSKLKDAGLAGIEAFNSAHKAKDARLYQSVANDLGLLISGGSDFHGTNKPRVKMGEAGLCGHLTGKQISSQILEKAFN